MSTNNLSFDSNYIKAILPKRCTCHICGMEQDFRKHSIGVKKVKDVSLEKPHLLLVERVRAKCLNLHCHRSTFVLPSPVVNTLKLHKLLK